MAGLLKILPMFMMVMVGMISRIVFTGKEKTRKESTSASIKTDHDLFAMKFSLSDRVVYKNLSLGHRFPFRQILVKCDEKR